MKIIHFDREEIALARVSHLCLEKTRKETGEAVAIESFLPIIASKNFGGQNRKCLLSREFAPGGEFGNKVFSSTRDEIRKAASVIFERLEPMAIAGFLETGKPNVFAYLASTAFCIMKKGGCDE